ncbi:MAG: hypothetical protein GEU75_14500 [Dehalococcoidia bacterium]|nr:hypothetical protein [Dehalococcoidia bacterium]
MEIRREVEETQVKPVAGIWACPNCGRRIQVIAASETPKVQPFTCVCGALMEPGEEHAQAGEEPKQPKPVDD